MYIFYDPISPSKDRRRVILLMNVMTIYDICFFLFLVADEVEKNQFPLSEIAKEVEGWGDEKNFVIWKFGALP
jgi:hypothetical protein